MTALPARRGQRGIILIAVLLAVAIMSLMVVAAASLTRAGIGNEDLEQRRLASHLALRSGLEAAKALILATPEDQRLFLSGAEMPVDLGNGLSATVTLRDAAGLADLNRSDPKLIEAVARFGGLGPKEADGLADRIAALRKEAAPDEPGALPQKAPSQPSVGGAAAAQPAPGVDAARQKPVPIIFISLDQVPDILDIPPEDARALGVGLTVFNPTGAINPLAAPEQVLQAIPGITEQDMSDIAMARKSGTGAKDGRLQQLMQRLPGLLTLAQPSVFMVTVKLDQRPGVLPGSAANAVVRLLPEGQMPFGTLALEEE
jgi:general secretion pathway protein K